MLTKYRSDADQARIDQIASTSGIPPELLTALMEAAGAPVAASLDHVVARLKYLLKRKLLPALDLDKGAVRDAVSPEADVEERVIAGADEDDDNAAEEDIDEQVERVLELRDKYFEAFGQFCMTPWAISIATEISIIEGALASGVPHVYVP